MEGHPSLHLEKDPGMQHAGNAQSALGVGSPSSAHSAVESLCTLVHS